MLKEFSHYVLAIWWEVENILMNMYLSLHTEYEWVKIKISITIQYNPKKNFRQFT